MRLVQVMVPAGKQRAILGVLDDEGIDYALVDEASGREYTAVVTFPLPTGAVEPVLAQLREAGVERDAYTVVVDAQTVISRRFEDLVERYEERNENGDRIAREELVAGAKSLAPRWSLFLVMTIISAVVATAGLLLDSPAVVVGSMVIAPLIGPAMATSVGTVLDDNDLFLRGVRLQLVGGVLAVVSAAVFAFLLRYANIVPLSPAEVFAIDEVRERLSPDVLSLAVALGAGVAGALSLSSGVSSSLVGVMIAAALVPPTAVVGIGLAWGKPLTVVGSGVLVAVNFLSINFAALAVLWYQGYRPTRWFRADEARGALVKRIVVLGVSIILLSVFLGGVTLASYQTATFERDARATATDVVATHDDLTLLSVDVQHGDAIPVQRPQRVVLSVGHPPGVDPPPLADQLAERINAAENGPFGFGLDLGGPDRVVVEVQYLRVESSNGIGG